ncbi:hypothetical protein GCM10009840_17800 [Pseudolysinimonas kribbensis]
MSDPQVYMIVVEGIDNTQRALMHNWIKANAEAWWHQLADVWVVIGHDAGYWRDGLTSFALPVKTKLLVIAVKETPGGRWASKWVEGTEWFGANLPRAKRALDKS